MDLNHAMFGGVPVDICIRQILGIRADDIAQSMHVTLKPCFPAELDHASGSVTTYLGRMSSSWHRKGTAINYHSILPEGVTRGCASVHPVILKQFKAHQLSACQYDQHRFVPTSYRC